MISARKKAEILASLPFEIRLATDTGKTAVSKDIVISDSTLFVTFNSNQLDVAGITEGKDKVVTADVDFGNEIVMRSSFTVPVTRFNKSGFLIQLNIDFGD